MSKVNSSCQGAGVVPAGVISCDKCGRLWASLRAYENHECVTRLELIYWLLRAYQSGHREGWEPGPSTDETMDRILDILANAGYDPNHQKAKDLMAEFETGSGYCEKHRTSAKSGEPCWQCVNERALDPILTELLPCPFDGGDEVVISSTSNDGPCVHCFFCDAYIFGDTVAECVKKWNARAAGRREEK